MRRREHRSLDSGGWRNQAGGEAWKYEEAAEAEPDWHYASSPSLRSWNR